MTRLILSIENVSIPTKQELSKANFLLFFLKLSLVWSAATNLFYEKLFLLPAKDLLPSASSLLYSFL